MIKKSQRFVIPPQQTKTIVFPKIEGSGAITSILALFLDGKVKSHDLKQIIEYTHIEIKIDANKNGEVLYYKFGEFNEDFQCQLEFTGRASTKRPVISFDRWPPSCFEQDLHIRILFDKRFNLTDMNPYMMQLNFEIEEEIEVEEETLRGY